MLLYYIQVSKTPIYCPWNRVNFFFFLTISAE